MPRCRRIPLVLTLAGAFMTACAPPGSSRPGMVTPSGPPDAAVADTVRRLMAELDQAASALDVDRFMSYFLRDTSLVYAVSGTLRRGWNEVARSHRES